MPVLIQERVVGNTEAGQNSKISLVLPGQSVRRPYDISSQNGEPSCHEITGTIDGGVCAFFLEGQVQSLENIEDGKVVRDLCGQNEQGQYTRFSLWGFKPEHFPEVVEQLVRDEIRMNAGEK